MSFKFAYSFRFGACSIAIALGIAAGSVNPAAAQSLPNPTVLLEAQVWTPPPVGWVGREYRADPWAPPLPLAGSISTSFAPYNAFAQASYSLLGGGSVSVSSYSGNSIYVDAMVAYYIEVTGPKGQSVPVDVSGSVIASGSGIYAGTYAIVSIFDGYSSDQSILEHACTQNCPIIFTNGGVSSSHVFEDTLFMVPNQIYEVRVNAGTIFSGGGSLISGGGTGSADPFFAIDPTFGQAAAYSIVESPGIVNSPTTAVPELSTWLLCLTGFGVLGFVRALRGEKLLSA